MKMNEERDELNLITMLPNLSGVSFKDALKALLKTPPPKKGKK